MVTGMCCWLNHWSVVSSLKEMCRVVKSPYMVMVMCEIVELNSNSHSDNSRGVKIWLTLPLWGFISSWEGKRVNRSVILSLMWYLLRRSIALWLSFFLLSFTWVLTSFSWYIIPSGPHSIKPNPLLSLRVPYPCQSERQREYQSTTRNQLYRSDGILNRSQPISATIAACLLWRKYIRFPILRRGTVQPSQHGSRYLWFALLLLPSTSRNRTATTRRAVRRQTTVLPF